MACAVDAHLGQRVRALGLLHSLLHGRAADARLLPVQLHFASYGYSSAGQRALTGAVPRLRIVERSEDLADVCWGDATGDAESH